VVSSEWVIRLLGYQVAEYQGIRITGKQEIRKRQIYPDNHSPINHLISIFGYLLSQAEV